MQPELGRGHVQRVRVVWLGEREIALLEVRVPGETLHLVCAAGIGVGVVAGERRERLRDALRAAPASPAQRPWRQRFEGAEARAGLRAIELAREGRVVRALTGESGERSLRLDDGPMAEDQVADRSSLEERGAAVADSLVVKGVEDRRSALRRALIRAIARVTRREAAVQGDLVKMESAEAMAQRAQLFVAEAARAPRGIDRLRAVDWSTGEGVAIELPIDPARSAKEHLDGLFRRARRLKEGAAIARARLGETQAALGRLEEARSMLAADADLLRVEALARSAAPRDFKLGPVIPTRTRTPSPGPRPPYRTFIGASGARILVGRGAAQNDALTLHVARPHDLWLHAKDRGGAHVVVSLEKGSSCPPDLLVEAAHLAAHFSDARDERIVDIQYTPRRYLRKPRGSPPGFVLVDREKVFVLRQDERLLRRLLESEQD
jgi:predicted ribosome quality control (RQC) complex YloA/Tae2 family protein